MVSIWILDKRSMAEAGASPAEIEAAAETARRDASALARLKHPAVVKVWRCKNKNAVPNAAAYP